MPCLGILCNESENDKTSSSPAPYWKNEEISTWVLLGFLFGGLNAKQRTIRTMERRLGMRVTKFNGGCVLAKKKQLRRKYKFPQMKNPKAPIM